MGDRCCDGLFIRDVCSAEVISSFGSEATAQQSKALEEDDAATTQSTFLCHVYRSRFFCFKGADELDVCARHGLSDPMPFCDPIALPLIKK